MSGLNIAEIKDSHPTTRSVTTQLKDIRKKLPLRVLSEEDWHQWTTYGFVIVRKAVPQAQVERTAKLLWEFQEMDPADQTTWYKPQLRDHQMKELNRQMC